MMLVLGFEMLELLVRECMERLWGSYLPTPLCCWPFSTCSASLRDQKEIKRRVPGTLLVSRFEPNPQIIITEGGNVLMSGMMITILFGVMLKLFWLYWCQNRPENTLSSIWDCRDGSFRGPRNRGALPCLQKAAIGEPSELYYYERNKAGWAGWAGWEFAAVVGCTVQKDEQWETLIGKSDETRLGRSQESLPVGWKKPFSLRPEVSTLQVQVRSWYSEITS